jgi:hypothetical protein
VSNLRAPLLVVLAAATMGCGAGSAPAVDEAPSAGGVSVAPAGKLNTVVSGGAKDSVESIPGSESSPYVYRFRMTDPSGSGFSYQDRDLSFYFRPGPDALYFQVENRQNRVVWIDWERSVFYGPVGASDKVAHNTTRWEDRFQSQPSTQIPGLGRFGDSVFPMNYLYDPAGRNAQLHRPLLPEDATAPQYTDRAFGVDLVFIVEDRPRTYSFRFRVASVTPR